MPLTFWFFPGGMIIIDAVAFVIIENKTLQKSVKKILIEHYKSIICVFRFVLLNFSIGICLFGVGRG